MKIIKKGGMKMEGLMQEGQGKEFVMGFARYLLWQSNKKIVYFAAIVGFVLVGFQNVLFGILAVLALLEVAKSFRLLLIMKKLKEEN